MQDLMTFNDARSAPQGLKPEFLRSQTPPSKGPSSTVKKALAGFSCRSSRPLANRLAEVRAHDGIVVLRQAAYDFLLKVVATRRCSIAVALLERGTALFNIFFQAIVEI